MAPADVHCSRQLSLMESKYKMHSKRGLKQIPAQLQIIKYVAAALAQRMSEGATAHVEEAEVMLARLNLSLTSLIP
jgi:hypothetical protein